MDNIPTLTLKHKVSLTLIAIAIEYVSIWAIMFYEYEQARTQTFELLASIGTAIGMNAFAK